MFGQHGHSQRTEFSVPILNLGEKVISRVAFDSWPDPTLRGEERPFFMAFIADEATEKILNPHLDFYIFEYLDILEREEANFKAKQVWDKIVENYSSSEKEEKIDKIIFDVDSEYAIPRALKDLENARKAWNSLKDRNQLWTALRVANRLENVDDKGSGAAFELVGEIFLEGNTFHEAKEAFEKASEAFARIRVFEKSGENSYYAGKCAFNLGNLDKAVELIQAGSIWIKDQKLTASLDYDLGIILNEQKRFEEANTYFEKAVKIASVLDARLAANYSSAYASKLMIQAEKEKEENPTYALALMRRSADQRIESAQFLKSTNEGQKEAATSLILAASAYFLLGNNEKGVNLLEEATNFFIEIDDYISASRSLYDAARTLKDQDKAYTLLNRAEKLLIDYDTTIHRNRILGFVIFEKAKIERKMNQILNAIKSYEKSLQYLQQSDVSTLDLVPIQIQCANCLFKMEDFEKAAKLFLTGYESLSSLPSNDNLVEQLKKTQINALISLKRASIIYHNSGIVALKRNEEKLAIEMFSYSISLLIEWIENNINKNKKEVDKTVIDRINTLVLKNDLFVQAGFQYKLKSMIDNLNLAFESYNLSYTD